MDTIRPSNLRRAAAAIAILLLMLSSQVGGTLSSAAPQPQQAIAQAPPQPASIVPPKQTSPGQLTVTNTWNRPLPPACPPTAQAEVQSALKPEVQSWTLTSSVPYILAGGAAASTKSIEYYYTAFSNGTFIASDDQGNTLSWKGVTGLPSGAATIRLYGNSTEALQLYTVGPAAHPTANFTVAYHLRQTSPCQTGGVKVTIQGWADWPSASGGTLRIIFNGQQVSANSTGVSFGGRGGMALVFSWSDSMKAVPTAFQSQAAMVSWSVGSTFKIDPSIVGTSSSQQAINWGNQRKLWHTTETNGTTEYWAFYFDGYEIEEVWSLNGVSWHSGYLTSTVGAITSGSEFSSWMYYGSGVYTLYYVLADPGDGGFILGVAQLGNNGAVNNLVQTEFGTVWGGDSYPCVYGTSTDVLVGIATAKSGAYQLEVYHISPGSKQVLSKVAVSTGSAPDGCIPLGLSSGFALLYGAAATGGPTMIITSANGNVWSAATTTPTTSPITMSSAVSLGNTVDFATVTGAGEGFWSCVYPCSTTSPVLTLASDSGGVTYDNIVLSTNARAGGASVTATYHSLGGAWSRTSDDSGQSWTPAQEVSGSSGVITSGSLQGDYDYVEGTVIVATTDVAWVVGTASPYDILFPAFPVVVPSAATTSDPWARSGYSPYESYFSQLSEYVSPGNGLLGVSQTDITLPGRSPVLSVTRVYSQPSDFVGATDPKVPYGYDNYTLSDLGIGWELGFPWITADYLHPGNGASIPLSFNSSNIMEYHGATSFVLCKNSNNTYTLYTADGTKYVFAGLRLSTISSPDSAFDMLTFSYNTTPGYITQITDGEGRSVAFSYNSNNTLASISSGGQTWRYTYSGSDLSSVTDPLGRVTRYYYALYNPWLIAEIAYPTGAATYYTYDTGLVAPEVSTFAVLSQYEYSSGSAQLLVRSNTYLFNMVDGSMVSSQVFYANATGVTQGSTVFDFRNINGKYVEVEYQKDQSGNLLGSVETDFDQDGRANETILYSAQGAKLAYSVTHFDNWGNVNFTQDYDGHDTYSAYANTKDQYQFGNGKTGLIQDFYTNSTISKHIHTDLLGTAEFQDAANSKTPEETFYLYSNNEVLKEAQLYSPSAGVTTWLITAYTYDSLANLQTVTDPLHHETCYSYSSAYNAAFVTSETSSGSASCFSAPDVTVSFTYNFATGEMTSQTDAEGNTTSYTYDALGRVAKVSYPSVGGVVATTSYSYDDVKNIVTETDSTGNITKYYYDGLGRLTEEQAYLSPSTPYSAEYYTYNWLNEVQTNQTPNGAAYKYTYDSLGRQTGVTNPDGSHESATYNDTTNTQTVTDGDDHVTQDVYDFMQNLVAVKEYWSATGYNETAYTYDGVGNLIKTTGPDANQVTQYSYDDLNRLVKTKYPDGTTQRASYDAVGDLLTSTDQEGRVTSYAYDFLYRLTEMSYPDGSSTTYTYDKNGNELTMTNAIDQIKYSYDALNRMTSETDTIGGTSYTVSYGYDLAGDLQSMTYPDHTTVTDSYDALGRVTKVATGATAFATFTYNPDGTINTMTYGDGEVTSYAYDSMDRPTSITTSQGSTQELGLSYRYDGAGNVVSINSETFSYDALERLTSATGPWGAASYSYDPAGNMVQKQNSSSSTTKYAYNSMDELVRSSTASGVTTYSYDGDGDLVLKNDGTNVWTYSYDAQGQLTKVLENGVVVQQNLYDGDGRRVEQVTTTGTTLYLYSGLNMIYEKNLQTGVTTKHVYADGVQVASITTSTTLFLHQDELGSTRLVTSGGSPVFSSDYIPYGVQYGATGSEEFMYAGMLYDAVTGLYYDNARFYDPNTGKFMTADPIGGVLSDPQSLNAYAYARDNPLTIIDPSGLAWWNPLSWTPTQAILVGAIIGLTIANAFQFGLDPITDTSELSAVSALTSSFVGGAISGVAAAAAQEELPVQATISDEIGGVLQDSVTTEMASMLDELGPKAENPQATGEWGESFMRPLMKSLGFIEGKIIQTSAGKLYPDFFNPDTGIGVDIKVGSQTVNEFTDTQMAKYALAQMSGQASKVLYILINNPWSGTFAGQAFRQALEDYGISYIQITL